MDKTMTDKPERTELKFPEWGSCSGCGEPFYTRTDAHSHGCAGPKPAPQAEAPRQWWIVRSPVDDEHALYVKKPAWQSVPLGHERIHVVEYSAFDRVVRERDEYVEEAERFQHKCIDLDLALGISQRELNEARAERDELRNNLPLESARSRLKDMECQRDDARAELSQYAFLADTASTQMVNDRLKRIPALIKERDSYREEVSRVKAACVSLQEHWLEQKRIISAMDAALIDKGVYFDFNSVAPTDIIRDARTQDPNGDG